ncbi:ABC transporter permease [Fictibacillus nanhaiensis]|uniref:ABC transporter permease n=1 Tax=Fictibacillus nanhaiensis TaxID=742169 RepID=UPI001C9536CE|nr:ABC transporter permease [Fictibacillus nanhaiensis]MBY6035056.1 ABC transporter permease [Fictibacillus nanhaiensis]
MRENKRVHQIIVTITLLYLFIPLAATFLYSLSTTWNKTILPEGLTLKWFSELFQDPRFIDALMRTIQLTVGTMVVSILIMVPAIFAITVYAPRFEKWLQTIVLFPYAMPGVVAAVGLLSIYSKSGLSMVLVLGGSYFVLILPFMYQGVRNSLRTVNAKTLVEAAELLGASRSTAFWKVIVPNITPGIIVSSLLSFSVLFGEFVLANILVGGNFETIQIYLYRRLRESGHLSSAIVVSYFLLLLVLSWIMVSLSRRGTLKLKKKEPTV